MTATNARIAPRNFWDLMTLTGSVAPVTGFEYTNTQNARRSFWRSPDATGQYVLGGLASGSIACNCVFMFRHHCHGGLIRVRGFSNNDGTGTTLFDVNTSPAAIYTPIATGYDHGYADATGLDTHDPLGLESPFYAYFTGVSGVKSVKWDFSSKSTTYGYAYWEVGRFFVGNYMQAVGNPNFSLTLGRGDGSKSERTLGGSNISGIGARWPVLEADLNYITEAEMPAWLDMMDICQTSGDLIVSVFPGLGGRKERDHTINGKFSALDVIGRIQNSVSLGSKRFRIVGN